MAIKLTLAASLAPLLSLVAALPTAAAPIQTVQYMTYCREPDSSDSRPLRQTIVVIDEALVRHQAEGQPPANNQAWVSPALTIADAQENENAAGVTTMLPHEQLSIYLARGDGSALQRVFVGCAPVPSDAEMQQIKESNSGMKAFFEGGPEKVIGERHAEYRSAVIAALKNVADNAGATSGKATPSTLIDALANAGRIGSLSDGIPRILLLTNLSAVDVSDMASASAARQAGFDQGAKRGIDLQRAEVYISGVAPSAIHALIPYLDAFLLSSRGRLIGVSTSGELPPLAPNPIALMVFSGTVDMLAIQPPVQVRIAYDRAGDLVNSWVETTTDQFQATPISGKAICEEANCKITGDGRLMGQAWNPDPQGVTGASPFQPKFAWSGLRYFNMDVKGGKTAHVRIWDPKVKQIDGPDGKTMADFQFDVKSTPDIQF